MKTDFFWGGGAGDFKSEKNLYASPQKIKHLLHNIVLSGFLIICFRNMQ